jgi:hypothetical protein
MKNLFHIAAFNLVTILQSNINEYYTKEFGMFLLVSGL